MNDMTLHRTQEVTAYVEAAGGGVVSVLLGAVGAVLSFWLARRAREVPSRRPSRRAGLVAVNALAALCALVLGIGLVSMAGAQEPRDGADPQTGMPGLFYEGEEVGNLYVFDGRGARVERARILTDRGAQMRVDAGVAETDAHTTGAPEAWPTPDPVTGDYPPGTLDLSSFPIRWGLRTGWEPRAGWSPPLALAPTTTTRPTATPSGGRRTSPEPTAR